MKLMCCLTAATAISLAGCAGLAPSDGEPSPIVIEDAAVVAEDVAAVTAATAERLANDPTASPEDVATAAALAETAASVAEVARTLSAAAEGLASGDRVVITETIAGAAGMAADAGVLPWWGEMAAGVLAIGAGTYAESQRRRARKAEADRLANELRQRAAMSEVTNG